MVHIDTTNERNPPESIDLDDEGTTTVRTAVRGMAMGAGISYVVCALALMLVVSWTLAVLIAVWPAVLVGSMVGGLWALSGPPATTRLAPVVTLGPPAASALHRAA